MRAALPWLILLAPLVLAELAALAWLIALVSF